MLVTLLLAVQQPAPERFSILVPVPAQDCRDRRDPQGDVVVCGSDQPSSQRLPLPEERVPAGPVASNPHLTGRAALAAAATPCAATQGGCQVGFGAPIVQAVVGGLVGLVQDAIKPKPDKSKRVPIPLD